MQKKQADFYHAEALAVKEGGLSKMLHSRSAALDYISSLSEEGD